MTNRQYTRNHYVPQWYQQQFLLDGDRERKFYYLDLSPDIFRDSRGIRREKTSLRRWGPARCFQETDLYTTRFGSWTSTEIEQKFFGRADTRGRHAVRYFRDFTHPSADEKAFRSLLSYMSIQKLRTPKGLLALAEAARTSDRNQVLMLLQRIQDVHCAIWTECVWAIADASQSSTKFIVTDHPVTVYNRRCFPLSRWCLGHNDPDIRLRGTHTIFPLSLDKMLILTNLSWVRNPYGKATKFRPNASMFRPAIFNFTDIQTGRTLSDIEVNEINFILKKRARRYIAAAREEWLYPEAQIPTEHWNKLGGGYLLMPDPRSMTFGGTTYFGFEDGRSTAYDEYGLRPWQKGYDDKARGDEEWNSFHAFQGEFARLYGPRRRGISYRFGKVDKAEDDPDYHRYHLGLERKYRKDLGRKRPRRTGMSR